MFLQKWDLHKNVFLHNLSPKKWLSHFTCQVNTFISTSLKNLPYFVTFPQFAGTLPSVPCPDEMPPSSLLLATVVFEPNFRLCTFPGQGAEKMI